MTETSIRLRISQHDAHYAGNWVDGARMLNLFGDVATELLVRFDGDEGLFRVYDNVEFLAPVYAGDFIEARGKNQAFPLTFDQNCCTFSYFPLFTSISFYYPTVGPI